MIITNPKRKTRIKEFLDHDHPVMDRYYQLLDENELDEQTAKEMFLFINQDPDFYDPYLVLSEYLESQGNYQAAKKLAKEAYQRAVKRIVDSQGNYPQSLPWSWLENRHIIRAIGHWARLLWQEGKGKQALEIFRKILNANPHDNTGARFDILAIRMGLPPSFLEEEFSVNQEKGLLDAAQVETWFDQNSSKFPQEFKAWFKALGEDEKINKGKEINKEEGEYFDDCPICQAMKKAAQEGKNLSLEELKKSFKKAKIKQKN